MTTHIVTVLVVVSLTQSMKTTLGGLHNTVL